MMEEFGQESPTKIIERAFQSMMDSNFDTNVEKNYQINASPAFAAQLAREQKQEYRTAQNGNQIFEIYFDLKVTPGNALKHGIPEIIKMELGVVVDGSVGRRFEKNKKNRKPDSPFRIYPVEKQSMKVEYEPAPTFMKDLMEL